MAAKMGVILTTYDTSKTPPKIETKLEVSLKTRVLPDWAEKENPWERRRIPQLFSPLAAFKEYRSPIYFYTHRLPSNGNGKSPFFNRKHIFKWLVFQRHLSFPGRIISGKCRSAYSLKNQHTPRSLTASLPLKKGFRLEDFHHFCFSMDKLGVHHKDLVTWENQP